MENYKAVLGLILGGFWDSLPAVFTCIITIVDVKTRGCFGVYMGSMWRTYKNVLGLILGGFSDSLPAVFLLHVSCCPRNQYSRFAIRHPLLADSHDSENLPQVSYISIIYPGYI